MEYVFQAIGIGFLLSVMVGPVFFILLETSITKGVRGALSLDLGVFISDVIYILFAFIFASKIKSFTNDNLLLAIVGGILFICYGLYTLFSKPKHYISQINKEANTNKADYVVLGIKGFMLNFANPAVLFYWIGIIAQGNDATDKDHPIQLVIFVTIVVLTYFGMDVLKIIGAKKLRPLVTDNLLKAFNQLTGIVFLGFGLFLIIKIVLEKQ